jgi:hypothetical protein
VLLDKRGRFESGQAKTDPTARGVLVARGSDLSGETAL